MTKIKNYTKFEDLCEMVFYGEISEEDAEEIATEILESLHP